jgi:hypothetical protein
MDGLYKTDHHQCRGEQNQFIILSALCCLSPAMLPRLDSLLIKVGSYTKSRSHPQCNVMMQPSTVGAPTLWVLLVQILVAVNVNSLEPGYREERRSLL